MSDEISKINQNIAEFWEKLPEYIVDFYSEYNFLIISFTLLIVVVNFLKILLAVTKAIDDIPLASSIFELIGLFYVIWCFFRYFPKYKIRQKRANKTDSVDNQITEKTA